MILSIIKKILRKQYKNKNIIETYVANIYRTYYMLTKKQKELFDFLSKYISQLIKFPHLLKK